MTYFNKASFIALTLFSNVLMSGFSYANIQDFVDKSKNTSVSQWHQFITSVRLYLYSRNYNDYAPEIIVVDRKGSLLIRYNVILGDVRAAKDDLCTEFITAIKSHLGWSHVKQQGSFFGNIDSLLGTFFQTQSYDELKNISALLDNNTNVFVDILAVDIKKNESKEVVCESALKSNEIKMRNR
jgi:hypothetical protein